MKQIKQIKPLTVRESAYWKFFGEEMASMVRMFGGEGCTISVEQFSMALDGITSDGFILTLKNK